MGQFEVAVGWRFLYGLRDPYNQTNPLPAVRMSRTLGQLLAIPCATCRHSYAEHIGAQIVGRFGGGESGLGGGDDLKIVGCTADGCKCKKPRFKR